MSSDYTRIGLFTFLIGATVVTGAFGQQDSTLQTKKEERKERKAQKNFRFSVLGGPGYTPDFGWVVGASLLFTLSLDKGDSTLKRSIIPIGANVNISGGYNARIRPQVFFKGDRMRLFGEFRFQNTLDNYYGIGYATNGEVIRSDSTSQYRNINFQVQPIWLFKLGGSNIYLGPLIDLGRDFMKDPSAGVYNDKSFIDQGGDQADGLAFWSVGAGIDFIYDTRDIPANAYKGVFLDFRGIWYPEWMGSDRAFGLVTLEYRQYQALSFLGKRKTLAWTLNAQITLGDVPLTRHVLLGSPFDLRGFYRGQYRDRAGLLGIAEYRHMFNFNPKRWIGRMGSRLGFTVWGGLGALGPRIDQFEGVLPNAGIGIRFEVQPRMNFRVDIGKNLLNGQNLFYLNMTEAF